MLFKNNHGTFLKVSNKKTVFAEPEDFTNQLMPKTIRFDYRYISSQSFCSVLLYIQKVATVTVVSSRKNVSLIIPPNQAVKVALGVWRNSTKQLFDRKVFIFC